MYFLSIDTTHSQLLPIYRYLNVSEENLIAAIRKVFKLTPKGIIETLQLRRPIYQQTAAYGHFGRKDVDLPWEQLDKVEALKAEF